MHNIDLFELARSTLEEQMCRQISDEQFTAQAYDYAEVRGRLEFLVKYALDDLLDSDKLSDELEDYILIVLADKKPEPKTSYVRNYYSQW